MKKKNSLAIWIIIGLAAGIITGIALSNNVNIATTYIKPFGILFLNLIQMIVVPTVLFSIISGIISLKDLKKIGSIGALTILFYVCTTVLAISIGLMISPFVNMADPGNFYFDKLTSNESNTKTLSLTDTFMNIFPSNLIAPLLNASMIQVIFIAVLFGFGIVLAGEKGRPVAIIVDSFTEVVMKIMNLIIRLSPIGIFALICPVIAQNGVSVLGSLAKFVAVTYIVYVLHTIFVYPPIVKIFSGIGPKKFFKGIMPVITMAFSSASSVGALPLNITCCEKLGAKKEIASFVLPLGATINMNGTSIYQGVAVIFISQIFNIDLSFAQILTIITTSTIASIGTAGVPGSGMIMLTMVLESVGLPLEGIAIIAGVDRILDMGRTAINVTGDSVCTLAISKIFERRSTHKNINKK